LLQNTAKVNYDCESQTVTGSRFQVTRPQVCIVYAESEDIHASVEAAG